MVTERSVWLTSEQTCEYLSCSEDFLQTLRLKGLPFYKPSKKVIYYNRIEVDSFINKFKQL